VPATVVTGLALLFFGAAVATAVPAAAVEDPARPDARVTHGPSCQPGGVVVEVTAGTAPYAVRLATTRAPGGEDAAELVPGETVVLRTGDVDWGETIDSRLEFQALDGSGVTYVDELEVFTFTRPAEADCAAIRGTSPGAAAPERGGPDDSSAGEPGPAGPTPESGGLPPAEDAAGQPADGGGSGLPGEGAAVPASSGELPIPLLEAAARTATTGPQAEWSLGAATVALLSSASGLLFLLARRRPASERPGGHSPNDGV
jgi:hypothetical protein